MTTRRNHDGDLEPTPVSTPVCPNREACRLLELRVDEHSERIAKLHDKADKHDSRLNSGDVIFAEVRKDIHALTSSVNTLVSTIQWVAGIVGTSVILAIMATVLK